MFSARAGVATFSKTAGAIVNPLKVAKPVVWLAGLLIIMCVALAAQSLNVSFTEYLTLTANAGVQDIVMGPDGALWFTETNVNKIGRVTTAGVMTEFPLPLPLGGPVNITSGPDGALWFVGSGGIGKLTTSGATTLFPVQASKITAGPDGALWFSGFSGTLNTGPAIGRITTTGTVTWYGLPNSSHPVSIVSGPDGALWFVDISGSIGRITTAGSITQYPVPLLDNVGEFGKHLAVGSDGALWFGFGNDLIGRITTGGVLTQYSSGRNNTANQIVSGPDGAMWFVTYSSGQIGRITTSGAVSFYDVPPSLYAGLGLALGPDGALWVTEFPSIRSGVLRVQVPARTGVFSHIAAGGGWNSTITLVNTSSSPVPTRLAFYADNGTALSLPFNVAQQGASQSVTGSTLDRVIGPNTTLLFDIGNQLTSTVTGWADVTSVGPVGGYAIFRSTPQTGSPSEGTAPLQSQFSSTVTLAYDNTAGFVMGVALANLSSSSANITATMWDDSGNLLGTQIITIAGSGHTAFVLPNQLTLTAGKRGIVKFQSAASGGITGLGLRFSPFGTFTSVPTM